MIARSLVKLSTATEGQRHYRLRAAACTIGGLLHVAGISETDAVDRLADCAKSAGAVDMESARKTARWGLERGRMSPFGPCADR